MTAIEWLITRLPLGVKSSIISDIDEAKEMEKQQVIDAYNKGCSEIHLYYEFIKDENITQTKEPFSAEQYYNEQFKNK
jgi:hypothetical protein